MGNKTSQVIAASNAAAALSMADSTVQEGRVVLSDSDPEYVVLVPLPPGVNKLQTLRIEVYVVESNGGFGAAFSKWPVCRNSVGSALAGDGPKSNSGIADKPEIVAVPAGFQYSLTPPIDPGNMREWAFRWTLSPVYTVPFSIPDV